MSDDKRRDEEADKYANYRVPFVSDYEESVFLYREEYPKDRREDLTDAVKHGWDLCSKVEAEGKCGLCVDGKPCNTSSCPNDLEARIVDYEQELAAEQEECLRQFSINEDLRDRIVELEVALKPYVLAHRVPEGKDLTGDELVRK